MKKRRRLYWVYSVPEDSICFSERYHDFFQESVRCPGRIYDGQIVGHCTDFQKLFRIKTKPLNVEIINRPRTSVVDIGLHEALGVCKDLWKILGAHLPEAVVGTVTTVPPATQPAQAYQTFWMPAERRIDINRGEDSWHALCPECGSIAPQNFNDKEAVLFRSLDDRLVYMSNRNYLLLDGDLIDKLELRKKFPDLRFRRIRIVDEPLDGDVLPGDPGWTGKFTPQDMEAKIASLDRKRRAARRALDLEMKKRR